MQSEGGAMQRIEPVNLSLVNRAYQELKRIILEHQIPQGGKLNEIELAAALGISRTPVREAINRLGKEGLVEIFPQRGAFVIQYSEKDIYDLFLIRENLEGLAAYLAAERVTEQDLARLESCICGFREPYSKRDVQRYAREDFKFHQTIVLLSDARRLINLIAGLHDHIRIFRLTPIGLSSRMKTSLVEHQKLLEALKRKDPGEADRRMRLHIRHVRDGVMDNIKLFLDPGTAESPKRKEG
jgi:DNA-binding GntR family transcriptional regulator